MLAVEERASVGLAAIFFSMTGGRLTATGAMVYGIRLEVK